MNKSKKKYTKYDAKRVMIIKELAAKHQVTDVFVRLAIRGERDSEAAMQIKKDFDRLESAINKILN